MTMISFITRVKPLPVAMECVLKPEALCFLFNSAFQRTVCTKNYLLSYPIYKQKGKSDIKNCVHSGNIPKDFGKVVELEEDFSKLEAGEKQIAQQRSRRAIKNGGYVSPETGELEAGEKQIAQQRFRRAIKNGGYVSPETREADDDYSGHEKELDDMRTYKAMNKNCNLLNSIMVKLRSKRGKEKNQEIVVEGKRIIYDGIKAGLIPLKVFFSRSSDLNQLNLPEGTKTYRIPYRACKLWGDVLSPQGIIGIFKMPTANTVKVKSDCLPLTVICDNVRDPSNLGAIIRIVASAGCKSLILTSGCAGVWEPKVLRAGAGAHFHFPILKNYIWTDIENLISDNTSVFIADGHIKQRGDSLENNTFTKISEISQQLPLTSYSSVEFENKNTVIIIGGETHGVSDEAYEFARKRNGTKVFIPLSNEIESLNNAVALAVLTFEYKRQLSSISEKECQQPVATGVESS